MARRDADVFRRRVDGERVGAETCKALFQYRASTSVHQ